MKNLGPQILVKCDLSRIIYAVVLTVSLLIASTIVAGDASTLLPADLNPVQAYDLLGNASGLTISGFIRALFNNFDDNPGSRRHYDHFETLDGGTFGMAHWPQSQADTFFRELQRNSTAYEAFVERAFEFFTAERQINDGHNCRQYISVSGT